MSELSTCYYEENNMVYMGTLHFIELLCRWHFVYAHKAAVVRLEWVRDGGETVVALTPTHCSHGTVGIYIL